MPTWPPRRWGGPCRRSSRCACSPRIGSFAQRFAALPGVLNVFFLAGVNDFQIHLAARSADDLRDFVVKNLSASRDVATTETNLIFEHIAGTALA